MILASITVDSGPSSQCVKVRGRASTARSVELGALEGACCCWFALSVCPAGLFRYPGRRGLLCARNSAIYQPRQSNLPGPDLVHQRISPIPSKPSAALPKQIASSSYEHDSSKATRARKVEAVRQHSSSHRKGTRPPKPHLGYGVESNRGCVAMADAAQNHPNLNC